jgi:hypothetical protein
MKTIEQLRERARAVANMHFYADVDDGTLWEPFENHDEEWIEAEIESLTNTITAQMIWAQGIDSV